MPDLDPCALLKAADEAWFSLNTGGAVRSITDQNGERIEYSSANRGGLLMAIARLQPLCPTYRALALGNGTARPLRFLF